MEAPADVRHLDLESVTLADGAPVPREFANPTDGTIAFFFVHPSGVPFQLTLPAVSTCEPPSHGLIGLANSLCMFVSPSSDPSKKHAGMQ